MLNQQIRSLRIARNMSQVELAHRLGISKQSVSNWEIDNIQPSVEMLIKLAKIFSVFRIIYPTEKIILCYVKNNILKGCNFKSAVGFYNIAVNLKAIAHTLIGKVDNISVNLNFRLCLAPKNCK